MTDPFTVREVVRVLVENRARFLAFLRRRTGSRKPPKILQVAFVRSIEKGDSLRGMKAPLPGAFACCETH